MDKLLSVSEFLALAPISRDTLYNLWAQGLGPKVTRIGRRVFINTSDAREWVIRISGQPWSADAASGLVASGTDRR